MSKLKTLKSLYHTNVQTHNVPSNDTQVQSLDLEKEALIPDSRFKQLDRNLKMTDFLDDGVTNSDLKLIRNRLKKGHINLKGFVTVHKSYWFATHARKTATISWIINDKYAIANVHDFLTVLRLKLI